MSRVFRVIKLVFLGLGLLLLLTIPVTGLISAASHWEGVCEMEAGQEEPCSWWEYAVNEMFWMLFIFIPYFFAAALAWAGMAVVQFVHPMVQKVRARGAAKSDSG